MEINENGAENIARDENHNYIHFGIQPVQPVADDNIQLPDDAEYHTLPSVPIIISDETDNITEMDKEVQKEKSSSGSKDENETQNENGGSADKEEGINEVKDKDISGVMVWEDQRGIFFCNECAYSSRKNYLLTRHLKTHRSKNFTDKKINQEENKEQDLKVPIPDLIKQSIKPKDETDDELNLPQSFPCKDCSYVTNRRYLLLRHARTHSGERPYKCKICEHGFTSDSSLQDHLNMHYGVKKKICNTCSRSFTTTGELKRHIKYRHTHQKPHKCSECDYATVERSKLQRHIRYHTGERPYQCQHCTYASHDTSQLIRHLRTHTGERPYKCEQCNHTYASSSSLKTHKFIHNPDAKAHACELCPAKFARRCEVRQHFKRVHYSDKSLRCKRCGETYSDRYLFKLHNKTHEGEKCFKCQLCCFGTKKFVHLKTHMTIHTVGKQSDLEQSFILNSFLSYQSQNKTHEYNINPDEKPYECQKCKQIFPSKADLTIHETAHGEKDSNTQE